MLNFSILLKSESESMSFYAKRSACERQSSRSDLKRSRKKSFGLCSSWKKKRDLLNLSRKNGCLSKKG